VFCVADASHNNALANGFFLRDEFIHHAFPQSARKAGAKQT